MRTGPEGFSGEDFIQGNETVVKSWLHRGFRGRSSSGFSREMAVTVGCCSLPDCAGCGRDIKNGQALLALDKQWHLGCFKCKSCGKVLTGEYISK